MFNRKHILLLINIFVFIFGFEQFAFGQNSMPTWKVNVDGTVKDEDTKDPIGSAKIELYKDTSLIKFLYAADNGKYKFILEPNQIYLVKVSMNGYISKSITINTNNVPENTDVKNSFKVKMQVSLFKSIPGIDFSVLNKPIGSIFYNDERKNFIDEVNTDLVFRLEQLQSEYEKSKNERQDEPKKSKSKTKVELKPEEKTTEEKAEKKEEKKPISNDDLEKRRREIEQREQEQKENFIKERENRVKSERENNEMYQARLKAELAEKHEKFLKEREKQILDARERALKRKKLVESVLSTRKPTETIPVEKVRVENLEGPNYKAKVIYVTLMGEEIEYKRMAYGWGGIYFKRDGMDITDVTFNQELRIYGVDPSK